MDPTTNNLTRLCGCPVQSNRHVLYGQISPAGSGSTFKIIFGSDLSNYYPNRGLKVFKARGEVLQPNYELSGPKAPQAPRDKDRLVRVGEVRYASTNRPFQQISSVPVSLTPTDLLGQKTALFGMTRTGKSNTTKIILKSVFALRWNTTPLPWDKSSLIPMANMQTRTRKTRTNTQNPDAIKNVWACGPKSPSKS